MDFGRVEGRLDTNKQPVPSLRQLIQGYTLSHLFFFFRQDRHEYGFNCGCPAIDSVPRPPIRGEPGSSASVGWAACAELILCASCIFFPKLFRMKMLDYSWVVADCRSAESWQTLPNTLADGLWRCTKSKRAEVCRLVLRLWLHLAYITRSS